MILKRMNWGKIGTRVAETGEKKVLSIGLDLAEAFIQECKAEIDRPTGPETGPSIGKLPDEEKPALPRKDPQKIVDDIRKGG